MDVTDLAPELGSPLLEEAYQRLPLNDKYRLIDLLVEPSGHTLLGLSEGSLHHFQPEQHLLSNMPRIRDL